MLFGTKAFTVAGQTFIPNPSAFSLDDTTISADGPAVTASETIISLGQNGALKTGSSTFSLPRLSDKSPKEAYTVAGQIFTPNPSAFAIAGTTISASGAAVKIDGSIVSLGQNGALKIDSSMIPLPSPADTYPGKANIAAGQTFTPDPIAFSIAGTIISRRPRRHN